MEIIVYSLLAGLSTLFGTIFVLIFGRPNDFVLSAILGLAGGVMFSVSAFELIPEAMKLSDKGWVFIGFYIGVFTMWVLEIIVYKALHIYYVHDAKSHLKTGYLVILGIGLHNLPEGLAIGSGIEASPDLSLLIAISLGIHNIPEGMATAGPLKTGGLSNLFIAILVLLAGLMTPLGTITGLLFVGLTPSLVGSIISFAAGAMIYLVINELLPKAQTISKTCASIGFFIGFVLGKILAG